MHVILVDNGTHEANSDPVIFDGCPLLFLYVKAETNI